MRHTVKVTDEFFQDAVAAGKLNHRSPPMQIEYWANLGRKYEKSNEWLTKVARACKDNPDLSYSLVEELLEEIKHPSCSSELMSAEKVAKELGFGKDYNLES